MCFFVLGNAAVDEFLCIEAWPSPGESILASDAIQDTGGKGANQAVLLSRCGLDVSFAARIGDGPMGDWIASELAAEGLSTKYLMRTRQPTDRSIILVGPRGENAIVTTSACAAEFSLRDAETALTEARPGDVLVMQGNLSLDVTRAALSLAKTRGLATAFNPSPVRAGFADMWPLVDLAILNAPEAAALTGEAEPAHASEALRRQGADEVVITLGGNGSLAFGPAGMTQAPARAVTAIDTTGAGDTFAAVLIAVWHRTAAVDAAALNLATAAAAVTVTRRGTRAAFPTRAELETLLDGAIG